MYTNEINATYMLHNVLCLHSFHNKCVVFTQYIFTKWARNMWYR